MKLFCLLLILASICVVRGELKKYYFDVKYNTFFPDGPNSAPKIALQIDDGTGYKTPAPTIETKSGDDVEIIVTNLTPHSITIHWHGFDQIGTAYADGANFITQWPIPMGNSYIYRFKTNRPGTYFYHAHGTDNADALVGAFIVREKNPTRNPYKGRYTTDDVLVLSAITVRPTPSLLIELDLGFAEKANHQNPVPLPSLIPDYIGAGKTMVNGLTATAFENGATNALRIKPGETKRIRIVNGDFLYGVLISFGDAQSTRASSIKQIAVDTQYIKETNSLDCYDGKECVYIQNGQRADILYTAPADFTGDVIKIYAVELGFGRSLYGIYPIVAETKKRHFGSMNTNVNKTSKADPPSEPFDPDYQTHPLTYVAPPNVAFGAQRFLTIDWRGFFQQPVVYPAADPTASIFDFEWKVSINGGAYTKFVLPDVPTIFDPSRTTINAIHVPKGQVVDLVLYNWDLEQHPFHLHGYNVYVTGRGYGTFDPVANLGVIKLDTPPLRDVTVLNAGVPCLSATAPCVACPVPSPTGFCRLDNFLLGAGTPSWTAVRVVFDREGPWLSHCHISFHMKKGMGQVFIVEDDEPGYTVPSYVPRSGYKRISRPTPPAPTTPAPEQHYPDVYNSFHDDHKEHHNNHYNNYNSYKENK